MFSVVLKKCLFECKITKTGLIIEMSGFKSNKDNTVLRQIDTRIHIILTHRSN